MEPNQIEKNQKCDRNAAASKQPLRKTPLKQEGSETEPGDGIPEGLELEPAEPEAQMEPLELERAGTRTVGTGFWARHWYRKTHCWTRMLQKINEGCPEQDFFA